MVDTFQRRTMSESSSIPSRLSPSKRTLASLPNSLVGEYWLRRESAVAGNDVMVSPDFVVAIWSMLKSCSAQLPITKDRKTVANVAGRSKARTKARVDAIYFPPLLG